MIQAVLGGLALGASLAALADSLRAHGELEGLGQGVVSAGPSSGGPFGGGPMVLGPGPSGPVGGGPTVSVEPVVEGPIDGDRIDIPFFPWSSWPAWPYAAWPYAFQQRTVQFVCRKKEIDDEEILVCRRTYPVVPVAWGPRVGWF